MNKIFLIITVILSVFFTLNAQQSVIPLHFGAENTGIGCKQPKFQDFDKLPSIVGLPNPFEWSDGSGLVKSYSEWECRRAEIIAEIGHYELGDKPARPADIKAKFADDTLTVTVNNNGQTVVIKSKIAMPQGEGPFPVIIGMNSGTGSLSPALFSDCIRIPYMHNQVVAMSMQGAKGLESPFYRMYPELSLAGDYCGWSWGISRLIDGLEIVAKEMNADLKHIAITGCSYAGKMALFGAAFDERIALALVQESGGGGVNSWRVSETQGDVEKISSTSYTWFMQSLKDNFDGKVEKLPYDHHELIALIAPRAVVVLGNPDYVWMADVSGYVASMAAREVWKAMGIEDRFGCDFSDKHPHCQATESQNALVSLFADKFLRDKKELDTSSKIKPPKEGIDVDKWIGDWKDYKLK
ncbi:MAG: hypothetical protein LBR13_01580 [Dysgonamonadaceae bacterium]|jgi:hypothetical protein|nr:hypothetical protein [Dysgonamonadaceae bacterium]